MSIFNRLSGILPLMAWLISGSAAPLSADQWRADLQQLRAAIAEHHPDPYRQVTADEFDRRVAALAAEVDVLDEAAIIVGMAELVAALGDGHTRLTLPAPHLVTGHMPTEAARVEPFGQFPVRFTRAADGYVVTAQAQDLEPVLGARLLAVGEHPMAALEQVLWPLAHGDNDAQRRSNVARFLGIPEVLAAQGVAGRMWRFQRADGSEFALSVEPLAGHAQWDTLAVPPIPPTDGRSETLWLRRDGPRVHARVAEISNPDDYSIGAFAQDVAAALAPIEQPVLALDLRGNTGGSNDFVDPLVRLAVRDERLWGPGSLFILTDAMTFSAAMNLASALERWTPAIVVGAETGGSPNHFGDARGTVLAESGLTVRISTLLWQDGGPFDHRDTIAPLVTAPATQATLVAGSDPALAAIDRLQRPPALNDGRFEGTIAFGSRSMTMAVTLAEGAIGFSIEGIGVTDAELKDVSTAATSVRGHVRLGPYPIQLHARVAGSELVGWLDVAGKPYPFVLVAAGPRSPSPPPPG